MGNSEYLPFRTVLCFENFKEAALYFDRVLPLNMGRMRGDPEIRDIWVGFPEAVPSAVLSHLIDGIEGNTVTYSHANRLLEWFTDKWHDFATAATPYARLWMPDPRANQKYDVVDEYKKLQAAYFADATVDGATPIRSVFAQYAASVGFNRFVLLCQKPKKASANIKTLVFLFSTWVLLMCQMRNGGRYLRFVRMSNLT